jgi:hypothetical protein
MALYMSLAGRAAGGGGGGGGGAARPPWFEAPGIDFATPFGRIVDPAAAAAGLIALGVNAGVAAAPRTAGGGGFEAPGSVRTVGLACDLDYIRMPQVDQSLSCFGMRLTHV